MMEAFELLDESQPTTVDQLDELTTFFEHTYIRGRRRRERAATYGSATFPVKTWNQHCVCVLCFCYYLRLILRAFK